MQTHALPGHSASGNVETSVCANSDSTAQRNADAALDQHEALSHAEASWTIDILPRLARGGQARVEARRGDVEGGSQ